MGGGGISLTTHVRDTKVARGGARLREGRASAPESGGQFRASVLCDVPLEMVTW